LRGIFHHFNCIVLSDIVGWATGSMWIEKSVPIYLQKGTYIKDVWTEDEGELSQMQTNGDSRKRVHCCADMCILSSLPLFAGCPHLISE